MANREKVMRGLECCCTHIVGMSCGNCPYEIEQREDEGISDCTSVLAYDALALLKEQETELICNLLGGQPYEVYCRECRTMLCILSKGETMNDVKSIFSYCPHCGRSVKWE